MRADVRRNRERILAAASDAFAEHGAEASFEDIARRAGIGSATLYRHFPTRYALVEELLRSKVEALCDRGRELLSSPDPRAALVTWLADLMATSSERGLADALLRSGRRETGGFFAACHAAVLDVGTALLERCREAGAARTDVDPADLLALVSMIARSAAGPDEAERLLALVVRGLETAATGSSQEPLLNEGVGRSRRSSPPRSGAVRRRP
jgi:AcrR family transcriptional regulator